MAKTDCALIEMKMLEVTKVTTASFTTLQSFNRSVSIVSLDEFVPSDEYAQVLTLKRQLQSADYFEVTDDESSCCDQNDFGRATKRMCVDKKKQVRFADEVTTRSDVNSVYTLQESTLIPVLTIDNQDELYWSKTELQEFQTNCKIIHSTNYEVQEYVEAFRMLQDMVMKSNETLNMNEDYEIVLDGLKDGWLGLEYNGISNSVRKARSREYVQTVIAAQKTCPDRIAEISTNLSTPSIRWAAALGNATHIAAEFD